MRIFCSHGLSSVGCERLSGDSDVRANTSTQQDDTSTSLARGQPTHQLQVCRVQEDLLDVRVLGGHEMRMVRHNHT